jgi:hypothetical protein
MKSFEEILGNLAQVALDGASALVEANNPAYAGIIALAKALGDHTNQVLNPGAATPTEIQTTAANLATAIPATVAAVKVISTGAAPATEKSAAVGGLLTSIEELGADFLGLFSKHTADPVAATPAPTPAS